MNLLKTYNHKATEEKIYQFWEKNRFFTPKIPKSQKPAPFVISMPPPNVTGKLHLGHAMFVTLEDILIRYHRMCGESTLWLPGTDHAGIATQNVVEKALKKEGLSKESLGRDKFIKRVFKWKEKYGGQITQQIRRLGASCDWTRERFTLDEGLSKAVNEAFIRLYEKGLIYQGKYIVNWCPRCKSAIADDEVEYKKQKTQLYYFKYDKNFPITIATTRPETKLGDTAVAVHPKDDRYQKYVNKSYEIDLDGIKRTIKIIADKAVDPKFGTGAVGITPAHSYLDAQLAEFHKLPFIQVINEDGRMTDEVGKYENLKVKEAREELISYLKSKNLLKKEQEIEHNLSICYRCETPIEPLPSLQWFVKMKPLVKPAIEAVKSGKIKIIPKRFEKIYFHWLLNIRDWCISRQLWWGHRIPVWYKREYEIKNEKLKSKNLKVMGFAESVVPQVFHGKTKTYRIRNQGLEIGDKVYFENSQTGEIFGLGVITESIKTRAKDLPLKDKSHGATYNKLDDLIAAFKLYNPEKEIKPETDAYIYAYDFTPKEKFENLDIRNSLEIRNCKLEIDKNEIFVGNKPPKGDGWIQDPDVLDTWFSSALWPFSTLGWPNKTADYQYFYPTSVMETGYDILFFWVARMIIMGLELTGKPPFETVYLHGLVRDEHNRKMSKSLGNVLDPLEVSDKYGTDAVRMSLVVGAAPGNDVAIGEGKIKGYRNFSNKIWNISRFILMNLKNSKLKTQSLNEAQNLNIKFSKQDKKDLIRLDAVAKQTTKYLDNFQFSRAGELLYQYTWHEFADKIIEQAKPRLKGENEEDKKAAQAKLLKILTALLKLLHPFMPFITEEIWQKLSKEPLITSSWPTIKNIKY